MKTVTEELCVGETCRNAARHAETEADADCADGNANSNCGKDSGRPAGAAASSPMSESAAYSDEALSALLAWETRTGMPR